MGNETYKCYDEIITQASAWQQAVDQVTRKESELRRFFTDHQPTDILVVGCGSPYYMGESVSVYWQAALGAHCRAVPASEVFLYPDAYLPGPDRSTVILVISRSGATTETIWAVEELQKHYPGRTLLISCAPDSPLDQIANLSVLIPDGYEQTVPQTRSFAAMYLATQLIGAMVADDAKVQMALRSAPASVPRIISEHEAVAERIGNQPIEHAFYMGSGPLYGIAREGALKMTEMTLTTCSAYPFMEARHGPRSIIESQTLVTGLFGQTARQHEAKVLADFVETSHPISVALTPDSSWSVSNVQYHVPVNLVWPDTIQGLAYLPVMHLMAYYRAVAKGVNPDTSRNLSIFVDLEES